jgi:hypothetical protein
MEKLQFHIYADVCGGIRNKILHTSVFGPSKKDNQVEEITGGLPASILSKIPEWKFPVMMKQ